MVTADSEVTTPEALQEAPPATDTTPVEVSAEAEPSIEAQAPPETPPEPTARTLDAIQADIDAGKADFLSKADREAWRAETNRRNAQAQARQLVKDRNDRLNAIRTETPTRLKNAVANILQAAAEEGLSADSRIVQEQLQNAIERESAEFLNSSEPLALLTRNANARYQLSSLIQERGKDPAPLLRFLDDNDVAIDDLPRVALLAGIGLGKEEAVGAGDIAKAQTRIAELEAEIERLTGQRGKGAPLAQGKDAVPQVPQELTVQWASEAPIEEILKQRGRTA